MNRFSYPSGFALAVLAVIGLTSPVTAVDPLPFKGRLDGELTHRAPLTPTTVQDRFDMTGTAIQLGNFELVILAEVDFGTNPPTASGTSSFVTANGDTLLAEFDGSSVPVAPGVVLIVEHAVITGGTGRFEGASGSYSCERLFDLVTWETIGSFEGTITIARP